MQEEYVNAPVVDLSIADQVRSVRTCSTTATELVSHARAAIDAQESVLKAWVHLSATIVDEAAKVDADCRDLPLRGISLAVKDLIDVAGMPTRAGSLVTPSAAAVTDAPCVARLRSLGAVVQGKTVTTEFGYFRPGPTRNPHAPGHTPGGSSSGSAAAVGAGTVPLALGTQTAGSLTRPSSYCGTAGMVLAHGSTDTSGIVGLSRSLDSVGFLTRTVADLRYVYDAFTGSNEEAREGLPDRAFIWGGSCLGPLDTSMIALLDRLPAALDRVDLCSGPLDWDDHVQTLAEDHATVMAYEAARTRAREFEQEQDNLSPQIKDLLQQGHAISETVYAAALIRRDRSRELLSEILDGSSVIIGPAATGAAPKGLSVTGSPVLSRPWQLLGLPVVVVPGARTAAGLPLGVQIIGLPGREGYLFRVGEMLEEILREGPPVHE
ncbi:amidase [Rhodococcus sp. CH91]|uniref:amidase n=1 Tax=Rhodococcus sp. CH91 TaxID=2910256 RepID=UPI001F4BCD04|nr:amidase [Rhodococcus sp. CH91]